MVNTTTQQTGVTSIDPDMFDDSGPETAWWFIAPAVAMSALLIALPLTGLLVISLFDWNLTRSGVMRFVGLGNYVDIFADSNFWHALWVTIRFIAETVAFQLIAGIGIALLLSQRLFGMSIIRTLFLAPMMIAPVFTGMIWRLCLSDDFGIVKYGLQSLGWTRPPLWLADPNFALHTIAVINAWQWTPFVVLFVMAGLQIIPDDLYEAAHLDGAGSIRTFFSITLPLLTPILISVLVFRTIDAVKVFDVIYSTTGGGPGTSTETLSYLVYQQTANFFNLGYGSAIAMVMLMVVALLALALVAVGSLGGRKENSEAS
ncbi:sugar ABC transporter permease [Hoeflea sp. G2-23]|uniref:Sugar ABC transporter permease n=1 Tax=Hoeflea algicola TaxID=2983763 RepID=A0ABT3Z9Y5_9HYPH|nr:sugar ABC transporter permease [Hoeflea algicola]MCY0148597.1 sugar ABC transporter permease [Hoeflea algicola]